MTPTLHTVTASTNDAGTRLDKYLSSQLPDLSRSRLQALIEQGCVTCDGAIIKDVACKVKADHAYRVTIPELVTSALMAQDIPLAIVFEDEHLLILDKPAGLTVHPAPGHPDRTLVNALLAHCGDSLSGIGGVARPGIVHRIDKETSGLLAVAKHDKAHAALSAQLADRSMKRTYVAVVWGVPKPKQGTITGNIGRHPKNRKKMAVLKSGGRHAVTHYKMLQDLGIASVIECNLETGRTHQIRVHLAHLGHPLVGDPVYGASTQSKLGSTAGKSLSAEGRAALHGFTRQALHAKSLGLIHPASGEAMRFSCNLPDDLRELVAALQ